MKKPFVKTVFYDVKISEGVDYDQAAPINVETNDFKVDVDNSEAIFHMKVRCPDTKSARDLIDTWLDNWSILIGLENDPGELDFVFRDAEIIPDDSAPGTVLNVHSTMHGHAAMSADLHTPRGKFPEPPTNFMKSALVSTLFHRYKMARQGQELLLTMAFFCLTAVENSVNVASKKRKEAAKRYSIDMDVLDKLGNLTTNRGDETEARKITSSQLTPLSGEERNWIHACIKLLIRRMGEYV